MKKNYYTPGLAVHLLFLLLLLPASLYAKPSQGSSAVIPPFAFYDNSDTVIIIHSQLIGEDLLGIRIDFLKKFFLMTGINDASITFHVMTSGIEDNPLELTFRWTENRGRMYAIISTRLRSKQQGAWETHRLLGKIPVSFTMPLNMKLSALDIGLNTFYKAGLFCTFETPGHPVEHQPDKGFVSLTPHQ